MSQQQRNLMSEEELYERIGLHEQRIAGALAPYEPLSATLAWFDTLRAIEECINLITVDWDDEGFERDLLTLPLVGIHAAPQRLMFARQRLSARFGDNFGNRFARLMVQSSAIAVAIATHGVHHVAAGFATVGTLIAYLQSRRRHFVALLHILPRACQGQQVVMPLDTLNIFLPVVEFEATQLMGAQYALLVKAARSSLRLDANAAVELAMLDSWFLDPERSRITEMPMTDAGVAMLAARETLRSDRLFSAAELRNDIVTIEAAYAEFDLASTDFAPAAAMVRRLSIEFIDRDFWVAISPNALALLADEVGLKSALRSALIHTAPGYLACLSTYAPFVLLNGTYRSTVTLLSRFLYYWRGQTLDRGKRFQIRAGFIFEDAVAQELERQGFSVQEITRINRHEFDVVTLRDEVIWNVQCKNNFIDLQRVEGDVALFARYNTRLVHSYERALTKERNREDVLKAKLSRDAIQHMVVSRFPVVTDNSRIVPFSRIGTFGELANALLVASPPGDRSR